MSELALKQPSVHMQMGVVNGHNFLIFADLVVNAAMAVEDLEHESRQK